MIGHFEELGIARTFDNDPSFAVLFRTLHQSGRTGEAHALATEVLGGLLTASSAPGTPPSRSGDLNNMAGIILRTPGLTPDLVALARRCLERAVELDAKALYAVNVGVALALQGDSEGAHRAGRAAADAAESMPPGSAARFRAHAALLEIIALGLDGRRDEAARLLPAARALADHPRCKTWGSGVRELLALAERMIAADTPR